MQQVALSCVGQDQQLQVHGTMSLRETYGGIYILYNFYIYIVVLYFFTLYIICIIYIILYILTEVENMDREVGVKSRIRGIDRVKD